MNMSTSSHFSSHLIDNQHERHDVIDRNASSGDVNAPVLKRFETGFETGLMLAMWKGGMWRFLHTLIYIYCPSLT